MLNSPPLHDVKHPVAEHFTVKGHTLADMTVVVIDQLYSHDPCLRQVRESRCIRTLGTSHLFGTNLRVDSVWNLFDDYLWIPWNSMNPIDTKAILAIPRSDNYMLDAEYRYNVYHNNNVLNAQILRKASHCDRWPNLWRRVRWCPP